MQTRGADRTTRLLLVVSLLMLGIILMLYLMKRSEVSALFEDIELRKSEAKDIEDSLKMKISALEQKLEPLQTQMKNTQSQLSKCEDQLLSNDKEIDQKENTIRQCKADLEEAHQSKAEADTQLKRSKEDSFKVKELTQDLVDAKATLESCQDHLTQLQKESGTNQRSLQHALQQIARCHEKCPEMGNSLQNVPPQNVQPQNVQPPNNGQFSQQRGGDGGMETVRRRVPNIDRHGLGEAQGADPPLDVDMKNSRYT